MFAFCFGLDPAECLLEEDIGAVTACLFEAAVMFNDGVEVIGAGSVALVAGMTLPDTAGPMDEDFVKTSTVRLVGICISQMPLAKNPRIVPRRF